MNEVWCDNKTVHSMKKFSSLSKYHSVTFSKVSFNSDYQDFEHFIDPDITTIVDWVNQKKKWIEQHRFFFYWVYVFPQAVL